jgi:hypothetical protein
LAGAEAGFHRALLRHLVDLVFSATTSALTIYAFLSFSSAEYNILPFAEKMELIKKHTPTFGEAINYLSYLWMASELVVLLFNKKRRALHDFIAGTVVIHLEGNRVAV